MFENLTILNILRVDEATTRAWLEEAIAAAGDAPNKGKVMGAVMRDHKGEIDGKLAQGLLKELLG